MDQLQRQSKFLTSSKAQIRKMDPSLEQIIEYLKTRPQLLANERNPYQADRLMMMLDNEKLAALEEEFNEHPNGIELPNFIWLMKCAISHPADEKYELVNGLIKLFQDIDINGDGHMEWAEFTQYIIDAVIGEKDARFFDARFDMAREMTEAEVLDRAYSRKSKRYVPMSVFDNSTHSNIIKKVAYAYNNDNVLCLEQNSSKIKFYSSECQEKNFRLQPSTAEDQAVFIIDFHVADQLNIIAAVTSDRQFYFWENNMTARILKNFKQDVLQTGIWYLPIHKIWVTAGADYNIRGWTISIQDKDAPGQELFCLLAHMKQITELVELYSPRLLASSSLDGKIKLWDLSDHTLVTELKSPGSSQRGVRGLTYSYEFGSNLLSYGFEMHINVWCPEVSITRAFIGKLEGHSALIVMCKFIPSSPNSISIDDRANIRIWDTRTMSTVQVISSEQQQLVTGICVITRNDRFVVTGKRLNYYKNGATTTTVSKRDQRGMIDDVFPISVEFNGYFNCFVVLTKMDIRLYDAMTGRMKKVFNELFDEKYSLDLSYFVFGGRQRKVFVSDNAGLIRQYNMKNGEFIKKVNQHNEIEKSEFANKIQNLKKRDTLDISGLIFLHEEKLLISCSQDSTIRIYDEADPEESILLKVLCGGNQNSEIIVMQYSNQFTLLATGSANGLVGIWDLETSKLDGLLIHEQSEILAIDFADSFPLVITGQQNGYVSIWTLKSTSQFPRYRCVIRISNTTFINNKPQPATSITSLVVYCDVSQGVKKLQPLIEYQTDIKNTGLLIQYDQKDKKKTTLSQPTYIEEIDYFHKDSEKYDLDLMINKKRCFIYIGDARGIIHLYSLTEFLQRKSIYPLEKNRKGQSYQLKRKDLVDASKSVEAFIMQEERSGLVLPINVHSYGSVLVSQWVGHTMSITKINKNKDPTSFITCSLDKHFKIWSPSGELWADVNLSKFEEKIWNFPFDWIGQKLRDIELVFDALKLIEKENLTPKQREIVKCSFLTNKFMKEENLEELQKLVYEQFAKINLTQNNNQDVTKEQKKRLVPQQTDKASQLVMMNRPVTDELKEIKKQMEEDQKNKKKIEVPTSAEREILEIKQHLGLVERPRSQAGELVRKLLDRFGLDDRPNTQAQQVQQFQSKDDELRSNRKKNPPQKLKPQQKRQNKSNLPGLSQIKSQQQISKDQYHKIRISTSQVMRTNIYVNNMVNSLPRPYSEQYDMKYQKGEGSRSMKVKQ